MGRDSRGKCGCAISTRAQSCVAGWKTNPWMKSEVGLRQGCVMSPTIFSIFINRWLKISRRSERESSGPTVGSILLFADDIVLMHRMRGTCKGCWRWPRVQLIKEVSVHTQKCKVMRSGKECTKWSMGGEVIQEGQSFTYLGVEFGRRVGWKR